MNISIILYSEAGLPYANAFYMSFQAQIMLPEILQLELLQRESMKCLLTHRSAIPTCENLLSVAKLVT
jgi:hypothetical protein